MDVYDPLVPPDTAKWIELDESEQIHLVEAFHRRARIALPNERIHAVAHVIVENQLASGDALPVAPTLDRLLREGLDRHDAVHAIGQVLMEIMHSVQTGELRGDPSDRYFQRLGLLTAESWLSQSD
jgi:hypothetical protein